MQIKLKSKKFNGEENGHIELVIETDSDMIKTTESTYIFHNVNALSTFVSQLIDHCSKYLDYTYVKQEDLETMVDSMRFVREYDLKLMQINQKQMLQIQTDLDTLDSLLMTYERQLFEHNIYQTKEEGNEN